MNGIVRINKPRGITSFQLTSRIKRLATAKKAGHAGTLDPEAEGVMLVLLNEACKAFDLLLSWPKRYYAVMRMGYRSDTQDSAGIIEKAADFSATYDQLQETVSGFLGDYEHIVPAYSAKKIHGRAFYDIKRSGQSPPERKQKTKIYDIALKSYDEPYLCIEVECSSGTYIRSLSSDIAAKFHTDAYITELKRISVGNIGIEDTVKPEADSWKEGFSELSEVLRGFQNITVSEKTAETVFHGRPVLKQDIISATDAGKDNIFIVYSETGRLLAISEFDGTVSYRVKRLFNT